MEKSLDQLKTEYVEINKITTFLKSISIFLIVIFAIVPLAEIVQHLEYHHITSYPRYYCLNSLDPIDILSFNKGA